MLYLFFTILGFALGSTLFAYWTPKIIRHIDIRELPADHNPGVANAFMYGGFFCGLVSLILELAKGFVPVFLGQRFLDTHSLLFIPVLIAPVFGHAFPFFRKEKGGKAITASFGVLLGLFPEMRPAVYLAFFFIFFSLIVVVSPHSFRSVVTFGLFALCVLFTVKVPSIQIGSFLIAAVVIYRHFIKYSASRSTYSFSNIQHSLTAMLLFSSPHYSAYQHRTSCPSSVTSTMISHCADGSPSSVYTSQSLSEST